MCQGTFFLYVCELRKRSEINLNIFDKIMGKIKRSEAQKYATAEAPGADAECGSFTERGRTENAGKSQERKRDV